MIKKINEPVGGLIFTSSNPIHTFDQNNDLSHAITNESYLRESPTMVANWLLGLNTIAHSGDNNAQLWYFTAVQKLKAMMDKPDEDLELAYSAGTVLNRNILFFDGELRDKIRNDYRVLQERYSSEFLCEVSGTDTRDDDQIHIICDRCGWETMYSAINEIAKNIHLSSCAECNEHLKTFYSVEDARTSGSKGGIAVGEFRYFCTTGSHYTHVYVERKVERIVGSTKEKVAAWGMRDSQRMSVYRAESKVDDGKKFETPAEAQAYVNDLLQDKNFKRICRLNEITVRLNRSEKTSKSNAIDKIIELSRNSMDEMTVLHEVAHQIISSQPFYIQTFEVPHGNLFTYTMQYLVESRLGKEHADSLRSAYEYHGLSWKNGEDQFNEMVTSTQKYLNAI